MTCRKKKKENTKPFFQDTQYILEEDRKTFRPKLEKNKQIIEG